MTSIVILSLPAEVIMQVFKNMGWRDILRASQTCRTFYEIAQDRSVWIHLLRDDSPTLLYRTIMEAPIEEYTTDDLKNMVLRNISSTLGWNSPRKPHERITPDGDFPIGDVRKVLLEGGRWLLSFGRNLIHYNPDYDGAVLACDLDSPQFASTIIYKDTSPEHNMVLTEIFAQVDRSQSCLAFTVGLQLERRDNSETRQFVVLGIEQKGRGPEAKLITSTIKSLICEEVYDMFGDYAIITYPEFLSPYPNIDILNWRTSSSTRHAKSTLKPELTHVRFGFFRPTFAKVLVKDIRLLPENKVLTIENINKIAIYTIPEFRWRSPLEGIPVDKNFQQPIWTACLTPQDQSPSTIKLSKPSYGSSATRLALVQDDHIYGLVIPHNGGTPAFHVLAIAPALLNLRHSTIYIDRIYASPFFGLEASMLAFSWPEEADSLAQPTAWVPPVLHFTSKQLVGHHPAAIRDPDLVDDVSGRVVTGSMLEHREGVDGVVCRSWSVVDFFHPQFLPSSFKS